MRYYPVGSEVFIKNADRYMKVRVICHARIPRTPRSSRTWYGQYVQAMDTGECGWMIVPEDNRCAAITRAGTRCKAIPNPSYKYCLMHQGMLKEA